MSILDTKIDETTLVDFELDTEVAPVATTIAKPASEIAAVESRPSKGASLLSRFLEQGRRRGLSASRDSFFFEPALYEEYRTSLARQNAAREVSLRD